MKNSKRFLMIFCAMTVLAATLFSLGISAVKAGEGTTIDEYTKQKVIAQKIIKNLLLFFIKPP